MRAVKCATKQNKEEPVAPQPNTDPGPSEAAEQKPCSPGRDSADQSDPSQGSCYFCPVSLCVVSSLLAPARAFYPLSAIQNVMHHLVNQVTFS